VEMKEQKILSADKKEPPRIVPWQDIPALALNVPILIIQIYKKVVVLQLSFYRNSNL
jgi:hypothetical protein